MKYSMCLSIFKYKSLLIHKGGLNMRVALSSGFYFQTNEVSLKHKSYGFRSGNYG